MSTPSNGRKSIGIARALELFGIAGIIVSLIFLGYELKRSNDIAETEAVATIYSMTNGMGLALAENPENYLECSVRPYQILNLWVLTIVGLFMCCFNI